MKKQRAYSILGSLAIVNFPYETKDADKKEFAREILKKNKTIKTVLEKSGNFEGVLRKQKTRHLAGERTKEVLYKENGCEFRFNVDSTYFSPRLSGERKEVLDFVKKDDKILVMCAGVGPFPIVIAKKSPAKIVYSNELNEDANEYARLNIQRNKLKDKVKLLPGDIKKVAKKLKKDNETFDFILMTRPQLEDTFLKEAFMISKNKTRIYYHGFCKIDERENMIEMIKDQAKKSGFKVKIINSKNIGEIAPYKVRFRILFEVKTKSFWRSLFG